MFKKPPQSIKPATPLRSSDRRKLRGRIVDSSGGDATKLSSEDADAVCPDGLMAAKFVAHAGESGTLYLDPTTNDPLWISLGKGGGVMDGELVPTLYTLFKRPNLLPWVSTPSAVIPVLVGGADLMIPGVIHHPESLGERQLLTVRQYIHPEEKGDAVRISAPLAVGRAALTFGPNALEGKKGKAVLVIHTWKDALWGLGSSWPDGKMPEGSALVKGGSEVEVNGSDEEGENDLDLGDVDSGVKELSILDPAPDEEKSLAAQTRSPQDVSTLLRSALLQFLSTQPPLQPASFPIPATTFYTSYILPFRPAALLAEPDPTLLRSIDLKHSSHKSLSQFLKSLQKEGLIKLKPAPSQGGKKSSGGGGEVLIVSVDKAHKDVVGHRAFGTVRDWEEKAAKRGGSVGGGAAAGGEVGGGVVVTELYKVSGGSGALTELFESLTPHPTRPPGTYTLPEIKAHIMSYIDAKNLVNANERGWVNVGEDAVLCAALGGGNTIPEFMKREEVITKVVGRMAGLWEMVSGVEGRERVVRKTRPTIHITTKAHHGGRKHTTYVTGLEPWDAVLRGLGAENMGEEWRRVCAGATSVQPVTGGGEATKGTMEVSVQGKQSKVVMESLVKKGVPKKWIQVG
ncbi:hypothetical protein BDV98DRAFT_513248 [Pterulicium gracile]|uniref:SUI1 domain-containing protein n=1 Tax=Pterulicium gracile TaxID=1884261 RepID=A0A5C3QCC2_9AGAR|nr:hypothetical protein BDV98DRAFT_513248 [Pterula gracilis]